MTSVFCQLSNYGQVQGRTFLRLLNRHLVNSIDGYDLSLRDLFASMILLRINENCHASATPLIYLLNPRSQGVVCALHTCDSVCKSVVHVPKGVSCAYAEGQRSCTLTLLILDPVSTNFRVSVTSMSTNIVLLPVTFSFLNGHCLMECLRILG